MNSLFPDIIIPDYQYFNNFYSINESKSIFESLKNEIEWKSEKIKIFGKEVLEPRLVAFYGEKPYKYSGKINIPKPFTPLLEVIKNKIEEDTNTYFNVVLLNYYRNGADSMGWHSDNEPELGKNPTIASLTFGAERYFDFRNIVDHKIKHKIFLENGSLLLMKGETQSLWQHQIAKSKKINMGRINLTFRNII